MRKAVAAAVALVVFSLVWSAAWFGASIYAGQQVDRFIADEARQGREWACPDRRVTGYPVALVLNCRDATYAAQGMGQRVDGQVAGLAATVSLAHPTRISIALSPPLSYRSSDGETQIGGTWKSLVFDLSSLPNPLTLDLNATDLDMHGRFPGQDQGGTKVSTLSARFTASPPRADPAIDFSVAMAGVPVPVLDELIGGGSAPIEAKFVGRLDHAEADQTRTPEEAMERWRSRDGAVSLTDVEVRRGGASVIASGTLGLDGQHRLRGRLDASFVGLEPILARYGISGNVAALGSLIGTLFGGGHPAKPAAPGALSLPISFGNGRLGIGPITTDVALSPLY